MCNQCRQQGLELNPEYEVMLHEYEEEFYPEMEFELLPEVGSSNNPDYLKWIQASLNRVLSLNLAVDGIMGTATRSAIRSFQKQNGLTADGVVGPKTESVLKVKSATSPPAAGTVSGSPIVVTPKSCPKLPLTITIGNYVSGQKQLSKIQGKQVVDIARIIFDSLDPKLRCPQSVSRINVIGHTDNTGSRRVNITVGKKRAEQVAAVLASIISVPLLVGRQTVPVFNSISKGPDQPISPNTTPAGRDLNRRVEVILM